MDKKYLMETCKYCGNKGMLKIIGKHEQHVKDYDGDVPIFSMDTLWRLLECRYVKVYCFISHIQMIPCLIHTTMSIFQMRA